MEVGSKVLVHHRRMFDTDRPRYFVGSVVQCGGGVASVYGKTWVQDPFSGTFRSLQDLRTKLLSLSGCPGVITYELPPDLDLEKVNIETEGATRSYLTDGAKFRMELSQC